MLSLALTSCLAVHAENKNQNTDKPNVIFIYADDLGYGDLECYGAKNVQTPNVNRLASEGIRFINAHATAATSTPSRYSMLTGEYAWRKPGTDVAAGNAGMIIRPEQYTMADMFKSSGYATGAFGKWHLGLGDKTAQQDWNAPLSASLGDLGFDYSYIMAATADRVPCVFIENGQVANYDPSAPIEVSYILVHKLLSCLQGFSTISLTFVNKENFRTFSPATNLCIFWLFYSCSYYLTTIACIFFT